MTQALAGFDEHGLVLATDSRATRFDASGQASFFSVEKLFPLTDHAAVISGGAGVSVPLSRALRHEVGQRRGLTEIEEISEFALAFLSRGLERYLEQHGPGPEDLRRIYFILAGFSPSLPPPGYLLVLLGSDEGEPLHHMPTGNLVVMPRNLGMEMRLFKALASQASLEEVLKISKEFLEKMAAVKEEVGPPFYFATITPKGYQELSLED